MNAEDTVAIWNQCVRCMKKGPVRWIPREMWEAGREKGQGMSPSWGHCPECQELYRQDEHGAY